MEREEIRERLMDLVDGALSPEEVRRVEEGIGRFPDLEQELNDLREAVALAGMLSDVEVPNDLSEGIRRAVDGRASSRPPRVIPLWTFGAAAAVLVLALGISILHELRSDRDLTRPARKVASGGDSPTERPLSPADRLDEGAAKDPADKKKLFALEADKDGIRPEGKPAGRRAAGPDEEQKEISTLREAKRVAEHRADLPKSADVASGAAKRPVPEPRAATVPDAGKRGRLLDDGRASPPPAPAAKAGGPARKKTPVGARAEAGETKAERKAAGPDPASRPMARKGRPSGLTSEEPREGKEDAVAAGVGNGLEREKAKESRGRLAKDDRSATPNRGLRQDEALQRPPRVAGVALATFEVTESQAIQAREALMRFITQAEVPAESVSLRSREFLELLDRKRVSEPAPPRTGNEVSLELELTPDQVSALKQLLGRLGKLTVTPSPLTVPARVEDENSAEARRRIFARLVKEQPESRPGDSYGYLDRAKRKKGKASPAPAGIDDGDTRSKEAGKAGAAPPAPAPPVGDRRSTKTPRIERDKENDGKKTVRHPRAQRDRESAEAAEPVRTPADESGAKKKASGRELVEVVTGKKPPQRGVFYGRKTSEEAPAEKTATRARQVSEVHYWLLVIRTR